MAEDDNVHDARGIAPEGEAGAALHEEGDVPGGRIAALEYRNCTNRVMIGLPAPI